MKKLAKQNPDEYVDMVINLLCSFIIDRSEEQRENVKKDGRDPAIEILRIEPDNQAALVAISRLKPIYEEKIRPDFQLSLQDAELSNAQIIDADLSLINFSGAKLIGAYLPGANLSFCTLNEASLTNAVLRKANLTKSKLRSAKLQRCLLAPATLTGAKFTNATIASCVVDDEDLSTARYSTLPPEWKQKVDKYNDTLNKETSKG